MKFRELVAEASDASIKKTLKTINRLNDEIEQDRENGNSPPAKKVKELKRLESVFLQMTGTSFDEYEKQKLAGERRSAEEMVEVIKTVDLVPGASENLIAAEAGETNFYKHILRDVAPQLPNDIMNALTKYLDGSGDQDDYVIANAVVERATQLGVVDEYRPKQVEKLEKHEKKFDYDIEEI
jgi:hypothetical protein